MPELLRYAQKTQKFNFRIQGLSIKGKLVVLDYV
jgi:hypothetical protein